MTQDTLTLNNPNASLMEPEDFQRKVIGAMVAHLTSQRSPALLVAPTGSGKTFMLGQVLAKVSAAQPTVWFWFTPYGNLVGQTILALDWVDGLNMYAMATERQRNHVNGDVLVANVQQVASKTADRQALKQIDDFSISVQGIVARARGKRLRIGVVVDEAHIGLSSETEFGKFVSVVQVFESSQTCWFPFSDSCSLMQAQHRSGRRLEIFWNQQPRGNSVTRF